MLRVGRRMGDDGVQNVVTVEIPSEARECHDSLLFV
jgi:hypothetical protein